jgi:hypothetical protein
MGNPNAEPRFEQDIKPLFRERDRQSLLIAQGALQASRVPAPAAD